MLEISCSSLQQQKTFLEDVQNYCQQAIAPIANDLDHCAEALGSALLDLSNKGWLGLRIPAQWGGLGISLANFQHFQIILARHSGALCFLQTQHQGAAMQLLKSSNQSLKEMYLADLTTGQKLLGVGFSQLRRRGEPLLKALPIKGGYLLNGVVPWVTGVGIFQDFIIGATLPSAESLYGLVPLRNTQQPQGGCLTLGEPLLLAAMTSTNTAIATLTDWFLSEDLVVSCQAAGAIHEQDRENVLNHGFFALGCAWAALDIIEAVAYHQSLPFLKESFFRWQRQLTSLQDEMLKSLDLTVAYPQKLQWRAQAISLASRLAHGAVVASGGAANLFAHPAQRVYREALLFSVSGQTTEVMEATIKTLAF